jgi:exosortase/archaeosortase family protein
VAVAVIAYTPLIRSVVQLSSRTAQAINAFVLLGFTFADAFVTVWRTRRFMPEINPHGLMLFAASCLSLVLASVTALWPLAVLGLCLNAGAILSFCWGREGVVRFYPALAGLGAAVVVLVFVPYLDETLRTVAAFCSAAALSVLGIRIDIVARDMPFHIVLVAERGIGVFDVATECNGIGIILSSLVITVVLALRRGYGWLRTPLLLALALVLGLVFNTIRIVAIAIAALQTSIAYGTIHEGLGTLVYLIAMGVVYRVVGAARPPARRP